MKKTILIPLLFALIACTSRPCVEIGDTKVSVEVPETPAEMARGLMHREHLGENDGMLFVFDEERKHGFWMKNTLIPLDMVFINSENTIVDILTAEPCEKEPCKNYIPKAEAKYVLEINSGFSEKHNIQIGEEVKLNI
ncbi:DUF192 domain-containing protein [Candidatus Woesearchaeota archaeon]|nr:DUF192 domain-containing protein [Candidatus Woesearchaeota archaeon]